MTKKYKIILFSLIVFFLFFAFLADKSKVYAQDCSCFCQLCAQTQTGCPNLRCDGNWEQDLGWVDCDPTCLAQNPTQPQLCCTWGPNGNYSCHCSSSGGGTTKEYNAPICSGTERVTSTSIRVSWVSKDPWTDCFEVQWNNAGSWVTPQGCGGCIANPGDGRTTSCTHSPVNASLSQQYRIRAYNSGGGDSNWTGCNYTAPTPTPTLRPTNTPVPTNTPTNTPTPTPVIASCNTATLSPSGSVATGTNVTYNPTGWTSGWDTLIVYRYNAIGPPATACGTYNNRPCTLVASLSSGTTLNFWTNISRVINGVRYSCMYDNTWYPSAPNSNPQTRCTNNCSASIRVVTPTPTPCISCLGDCSPLSSPCCDGYYCESATGKCIRSCPAGQIFDPRYETCSCVAQPTPVLGCPVVYEIAKGLDSNNHCWIQIGWNDMTNPQEDGYRLYRNSAYQTTVGVNVVTWRDPANLVAGNSYSYSANPIYSGVERTCPATRITCPSLPTSIPTVTLRPTATLVPTTAPSVTPPPCPACVSVLLADVQRGDGKYNKNIRWTDANGEDGYRIYRCTGVGCNPATNLLTIIAPGTLSYTDTNNNTGFGPGTWVYEVRPFKSGCTTLDCPNYTNTISAITPTRIPTRTPTALPTPSCSITNPSQPILVSPTDGETITTNNVILRWLAVQWGNGCPNNNRYKVYLTPNINYASDGNLTNDGLLPVCDLNENIVYCLQTNLY